MKRKFFILYGILSICLLIGLLIYLFFANYNLDGKKFKEEYSDYNVNNKNPFIYKSASDIVKLINNKETFLVYFGYPDNNKKDTINTIFKAIQDKEIELVYYVNLEKIRNEMIVDNTVLETIKMGTMGYYDLLKILDEFLPNYIVLDENNKKYTAGKRIENPTLLAISHGKAIKLTSGNNDAYNEFIEVIDSIKPSNMCEENTGC